MPEILCPCCGGTGAVDDASECDLTAMQRRIYGIVQSCGSTGIDMKTLAERVYASQSDGGPVWADDSIRVTIHQMNKRLARVGRQVKASKLGRGSGYRVVAL